MIGILSGLGAAFFFGSYIVPFKKVRSPNIALFQFWMAVGIFSFSLGLSPILHYPLSLNRFGIAAGVLWAAGNWLSFVAIDAIGVAIGAPIWISMGVAVSYGTGLLLFNEVIHRPLLGIAAICLIIAGVILVSTAGAVFQPRSRLGLIASVLTGCCFASYFLPLKIGHLSAAEFFFPSAVGVLLFSFGLAVINRVPISTFTAGKSLTAGAMWPVGNLLSIFAVLLLGIAKGQPLTQLSLVVAVLWGLFYFKEITSRRVVGQILLGSFILLAGYIALGIS